MFAMVLLVIAKESVQKYILLSSIKLMTTRGTSQCMYHTCTVRVHVPVARSQLIKA